MRKLYALSDGREIYKVAAMTREEWVEARRSAEDATGGNMNWDEVTDMPVSDIADMSAGVASAWIGIRA